MSEQQTILVTGGASGIGLAIVEAALNEGWRAIIADRDPQSLDRCRDSFRQAPDRVRYETLDVADEEAVARTIARCAEEFGPITGLVNSAGIGSDIPAMDTSAALFRKILEVNLIGSFIVSREVARHMQAHGGGSIVNMASVSGIRGNSGRVAYGSSKAGVINMTQVMAVELAAAGIRVNAVAPGPIETPLVREMHTAESRAEWLRAVPLNRYGQPAEIAGAAIFLLDGSKASYVTGQTISVDGGFTTAGLRHNTR
ncbi:SDR family NAD(P)-dependent oxidoreductase [Microvirga brassicacearum]|uniref:SDR family oxidoreductase n=1 Tax=Microvirga brassicacearum TaxID=2580413 RepID=A0A5N3PI82_9HYPH|nr:SDR family NAD(P)-dependent oxidoreductase [Microvirga brassicacearum]KAB0269446.1 SDR family oxidoreductase [Microvirga brassicacearum]